MDIGTWSRNTTLTKEQLKNRQELFEQYQEEYNKTHDRNILWEKMYPLILDSVRSNILKLNNFHYVIDFEDKVGDAALLLMTRYCNKPDYNFRSLVTLGYWAAVYACRREEVIRREKNTVSYEQMIEELGLHEEHILNKLEQDNEV